MAREVLTAAQHAGILIASDRGFSKDCYQSGIVAVTAYTDDWVVSVAIDVQHWCHGKVWSQTPELPGSDFRRFKGILGVTRGTQSHSAGHVHCIRRNPGHQSAFLVDDDKGWKTGGFQNDPANFLAERVKLVGALHIPLKQNHIAYLVFSDESFKILGKVRAMKTQDGFLPNHLPNSQFHGHRLLV